METLWKVSDFLGYFYSLNDNLKTVHDCKSILSILFCYNSIFELRISKTKKFISIIYILFFNGFSVQT